MIRLFIRLPILIFLTFFMSEHALIAQDAQNIQGQLRQAKALYYNGQFQKAQDIVLKVLSEKEINRKQQFNSLVLLAEIRRAINDERGARKIIDRILDLNPDYNPPLSEFPPNFIKMVNEEKQKRQPAQQEALPKPWYKKSLYWAGAGGAAVITTGILLLTRPNKSTKKKWLPLPPNWPETGNH